MSTHREFHIEPVKGTMGTTALYRIDNGQRTLLCQHVGDHVDCMKRAASYVAPKIHIYDTGIPEAPVPEALREIWALRA